MSTWFLIKDSLANKISFYHLMALMASLPFDRFYSHLILISFLTHTFIQLNRKAIKPVFKLSTLLLQSVFFITLLSTIYTTYRAEAFEEWGKQITIFIFPIALCLNQLNLKKYRPQLFHSFALVCVATIIYLYADAFITIRYYHLPLSTIFSSYFTNHNFSEPIDIHATFFSMQLALALIYLVSVLIKEKLLYYKLFYIACVCVLTAGLIQLCSKSVLLTLMAVINVAVPYFLLKHRARWKFIIISGSLSVLALTGILTSQTFRDRFVSDLENDLSRTAIIKETNDTRLERWQVTLDLIRKSPVIGYGAGSELSLLQDNFFNKKLYDSYLKKLNTHSQYLSFLLKSGIIGLLIYGGTLFFGFNEALKKKDLLFFTFMALIAVVSISENLLDVDKGIFFYAFFFPFLFFSSNPHPTIPDPTKPHKYFTPAATKQLVVPS